MRAVQLPRWEVRPPPDPPRAPVDVSLSDPSLRPFEALALKSGASLGGLTAPQRELTLALASRSIGAERGWTEREVNEALRGALARELAFLDIDHVELRRWLVDAGLWQRDGFGRDYRRVPPEGLAAPLREACAAVDATDAVRWLPARRAAVVAERAARRRAWEAGQGGAAGSSGRG